MRVRYFGKKGIIQSTIQLIIPRRGRGVFSYQRNIPKIMQKESPKK
jgi:hypothetical protein